MNLDEQRQQERSKYLKLSESRPGYGASCHGSGALDEIAALAGRFVLDLGCGRNDFIRELRERGGIGAGLDFAFPEADIRAPMHSIPMPEGCVDIITAFDSLEHLLPDEVDAVLVEMQRVARTGARFWFSIATRPSRILVDGENLHPTVKPIEWWCDRIAKVATVRTAKPFVTGYFN